MGTSLPVAFLKMDLMPSEISARRPTRQPAVTGSHDGEGHGLSTVARDWP